MKKKEILASFEKDLSYGLGAIKGGLTAHTKEEEARIFQVRDMVMDVISRSFNQYLLACLPDELPDVDDVELQLQHNVWNNCLEEIKTNAGI